MKIKENHFLNIVERNYKDQNLRLIIKCIEEGKVSQLNN